MADASGVPDETEAPALSTEAVDQEFAEMHPEAQESSVPEPAERTYAEDLELLFGDAPVADAPQVEPSPVAPEPAMEAPMLVSPEGEEGSKADPGSSHRRMMLPSRCRNLPRTARIGRLRPCPWLCRTFPSAPPSRKRSLPAAMKWKNVLSGWRKP